MFMRRRPLLRAAAIGGGAYVMGKKAGQKADQPDATGSQGAQAQGTGQPAQGTGGSPSGVPTIPDQLNRLTALHDQGALSDTEFSSAKAKLLGT